MTDDYECTSTCVPCAIKLQYENREIILHICNRDAEKIRKLMETK